MGRWIGGPSDTRPWAAGETVQPRTRGARPSGCTSVLKGGEGHRTDSGRSTDGSSGDPGSDWNA